MSRPGRAALAALLTAAALAVVLWRWVNVGVHPAAIALALFVLAGVPAVVWLAPLVPTRPSPHRLPLTFWIGVAMLAVAAGGILAGLGAARMGTGLGGGSSSNPMPPARQAKAPAAAVQAVDAVLPGSHIRWPMLLTAAFGCSSSPVATSWWPTPTGRRVRMR